MDPVEYIRTTDGVQDASLFSSDYSSHRRFLYEMSGSSDSVGPTGARASKIRCETLLIRDTDF